MDQDRKTGRQLLEEALAELAKSPALAEATIRDLDAWAAGLRAQVAASAS